MGYSDQEEIFDSFSRLSEYETISSFALAYYELIADHLQGENRGAQGLRLRLLEFLEILERYHRALQMFLSEEEITLGNVRSATEKRDISLHVLLEQLAVDVAFGGAEIGRLLLIAECHYQLAAVDQVVDRLELAVESGADHPLVHFALGYNRYELATQTFSRHSVSTGQREITDEDRFRLACLGSVSAFQEGLTGALFDGHIHWWIGSVLEAAGFPEAAEASFDKAAEILGNSVGERASSVIERQRSALGFAAEATVSLDIGPITEDEVQKVSDLLRRTYSTSDLIDI